VSLEVHQHEEREETQMETVKDPVCGMQIDPATPAASAGHDGATYYFCSESCHERFVAAPDQFTP
jgi:Cu+-exporting ATPase